MLLKLPHKFTPRPYQLEVLKAIFIDGYKNINLLMHRRAGKTILLVNIITMLAVQKPALYICLLPQTNQARRVIWEGRGKDGIKFLDRIPQELIAKKNNASMNIELINGSIISFVGSNNFDALVGIGARAIIYDEYSLQNPLAREFLSPVLVESEGIEILVGTPRGHNHAYDAYNTALNNDEWFLRRLTVDDTFDNDGNQIITPKMLERERANGKDEEIIQQEYYCSFDIGNRGAYYTREIAQAEYDNRIVDFPIRKDIRVNTAWDIGVSDSTTIVFFYQQGDKIYFIDYIEDNSKGVEDYIQEIENVKTRIGFSKWGYHFAPHDIRNREWGSSARTRISIAASLGLHFLITPNVSVQDRIQAGRAFMRDCVFHKTNCKHLIRCLREYMREYNEVTKVYDSKPLHNWACHGADAFTYAAVAWRDKFQDIQFNSPKQYKINV